MGGLCLNSNANDDRARGQTNIPWDPTWSGHTPTATDFDDMLWASSANARFEATVVLFFIFQATNIEPLSRSSSLFILVVALFPTSTCFEMLTNLFFLETRGNESSSGESYNLGGEDARDNRDMDHGHCEGMYIMKYQFSSKRGSYLPLCIPPTIIKYSTLDSDNKRLFYFMSSSIFNKFLCELTTNRW